MSGACCCRSLGEDVPERRQIQARKQGLTRPEEDRRNCNVHFVYEPFAQVLLNCVGAAANPDILPLCRIASAFKRRVDAFSDKVESAKRQVGNRVYGGQTSHLPLKLNMSGVIPPIFASSIILFPATIAQWFTSGDTESTAVRWVKDIAATLSPGQPVYIALYAAAIIFFCFFYTALVFNSRETAENLKKSGAFVPGIRPGEQTARFVDKILMRLTLAGAIYITLVCLLPEFLVLKWNVPFYFGGTSLLIIVVVTMDFMSQVQAYVMSHQYESLLKKADKVGK